MTVRTVFLHAAVSALLATRGWAQLTAADTSVKAELRTFVVELKAAVQHNDAAAVAQLVSFPLRINLRPDRGIIIISDATWARDFRRYFNANIRAAVLAQDPDSIFHNTEGYRIGNGHLWLSDDCSLSRRQYRCLTITALNPNAPPVTRRPAPSN